MRPKFLIKIAILLAIISMFSSNDKNAFVLSMESTPETSIVYGDANNDGRITAADARLVLLTSAHLHTGINTVICDIDNDNLITAVDARYILRASAMLDNLNCVKFGHDILDNSCSRCSYEEKTTVIETTTKAPETTTKAPETTTKAPVTTTKIPETTTKVSFSDTSTLAIETFEEINKYRASLGLYPLKFNAELSEITIVRAKEASVYWSHTRPDGRDFWTVFEDFNKFNNIQVGEILAKIGSPDAVRAVTGWSNSPSHNALLTTTKYNEIGIAAYTVGNYTYVCAHFIK